MKKIIHFLIIIILIVPVFLLINNNVSAVLVRTSMFSDITKTSSDTAKITCYSNSNCGYNGFLSPGFCMNNDVYMHYASQICINPGTTDSYCTKDINIIFVEDCINGCLNKTCKNCNEACQKADINNDNKIGLSDWGIYRLNHGRKDCNLFDWCNGADINNDSVVDINDFSILKENFGKKCCIK